MAPPRFSAPSDNDLNRVEELLGDLSMGVWAAAWLQGIEQDAWDRLIDGADRDENLPWPYMTLGEAIAVLRELVSLTIAHGWWPTMDGDRLSAVALEEWNRNQPAGRALADTDMALARLG